MNQDRLATTITVLSAFATLIAAIISFFLAAATIQTVTWVAVETKTPITYSPVATTPEPATRIAASALAATATAQAQAYATAQAQAYATAQAHATEHARRTATAYAQATSLATPSLPTQVAILQNEVTTLRQQVDVLSKAVASSPSPDVVALRSDLKSLGDRLEVIEKAVLDNPERALQITLLAREMNNLKVNSKTDMENIRQEISRVYDLTKWFIGLMFTIALSVLGLAVSTFIKKPDKTTEKLWTPNKKE